MQIAFLETRTSPCQHPRSPLRRTDLHDIPTSYAAALQDYLDLVFAHKLERERRRRRLLAAQRYQEECIKLSIPSTSPSFIGVAGYLTSYVERVGSTASVSDALSDLRCYFAWTWAWNGITRKHTANNTALTNATAIAAKKARDKKNAEKNNVYFQRAKKSAVIYGNVTLFSIAGGRRDNLMNSEYVLCFSNLY